MIPQKNNRDFSYYELYLLSYLKENHPLESTNVTFIHQRAEAASQAYEATRLEGYVVEAAQEIAMQTLLQGLHFSKYNTIIDVLWNEFPEEVPQGNAPDVALALLPLLEHVFTCYDLSDDFAYSSDYELLYTELVGAILILAENHGI